MSEDETHADGLEALLRGLSETVTNGQKKTDANFDLVLKDVDTLHNRLDMVENRQTNLERMRAGTSDRVRDVARQGSEMDLAHEAKLAEEIIARRTLEAKVDALDAKQDTQLAILTNLQALAKNPIVRQVATAIGTAALTWLSMRGIR